MKKLAPPPATVANRLLLVLLLASALLGCSRHDEAPVVADNDIMPEKAVAYIEQMPLSNIRTEDVILPGGDNLKTFLLANDPAFLTSHPSQLLDSPASENDLTNTPDHLQRVLANAGPRKKKKLLISFMVQKALNLVALRQFDSGNDPVGEPKQSKLAYVYGSRQVKWRTFSTGQCNKQKLYGTDCSGFIYMLAKEAGLDLMRPDKDGNLSTYSAQQSQPKLWMEEVAKIPELNKVEVKDMGPIETSQMQSGDIVYFKDSSGAIKHIGIVLQTGGARYFFHCYGRADEDCYKNNDGKHGPVQMKLSSIKTFFPADQLVHAGTLRIMADISGKWKYYDQCVGGNQPAVVDLDFNPSANGKFTAQGAGTGFVVNLDCTYTEETSLLDILLTTATSTAAGSPSRQDKVQLDLNNDDTGFVAAKRIAGTSGCDIQVKLVNQEK